MTQTLTTERQQFEEYFNDFYGCHPTDHHDPIHVEGIWHAWQDGNTRAANREAHPLAYRYRYNSEHLASFGCSDLVSSWKYCEEIDLINPDERYERQALFTAPPAPAVTGDLLEAMAEVIRISDRDHEAWGLAKAAISAYRGAILDGSGILWSGFDPAKDSSDAIPDGWKLVPVELTKEMQDAWDSAPVSSDDDTVNMMNAYRAMLAAAPEGGS